MTRHYIAPPCPCHRCEAWLKVQAADDAYEAAVRRYLRARQAYNEHLATIAQRTKEAA